MFFYPLKTLIIVRSLETANRSLYPHIPPPRSSGAGWREQAASAAPTTARKGAEGCEEDREEGGNPICGAAAGQGGGKGGQREGRGRGGRQGGMATTCLIARAVIGFSTIA